MSKKILYKTFEFTRPANTTAYTASDCVGTATTSTLTSASLSSGLNATGKIISAVITSSNPATTNFDIDVFVFTSAPTVVADNAVENTTDAQMLTCVGVLPFANGDAEAQVTSKIVHCDDARLPIAYATTEADGSLYFRPVVRAAYVPISAEVIQLKVGFEIED